MLHILLAEDNPGDVLVVREAIRTSGIDADVMVAYDGWQALQMLRDVRFHPDVVLLDLQMPKLNGIQVLERHPVRGGPPVVILTSSSNLQEHRKAVELGAKECVVKSLDLEIFMRLVREALVRWTNAMNI